MPNWQFDVICLAGAVAEQAASRFDLDLRPVAWHPSLPTDAMQLVVPTAGDSWFDQDELRAKAVEHHGDAGATCPECGVWRWMPLTFGWLPPLRIAPGLGDVDIAGSPEWFGDGWKAFRQILVRRELADLIATASPNDFRVQEVHVRELR